jgi:salicylate hydroxylase
LLGLADDFDAEATAVDTGVWHEFRAGEGEEQELYATTYSRPFGNTTVHRARFLDAMARHLPRENCHFGKRLQSISTNNGQARLMFADGTWHDTDVVIGFDGIHSRVRAHVDEVKGTQSTLQWNGNWIYRGLVPREKFVSAFKEQGEHYAKVPQMFCGKDRRIVSYPIDKKETINVVAMYTDGSADSQRQFIESNAPWIQTDTKDEMIAKYAGWGADMIALLNVSGIIE